MEREKAREREPVIADDEAAGGAKRADKRLIYSLSLALSLILSLMEREREREREREIEREKELARKRVSERA
jgi:hypothetical protein